MKLAIVFSLATALTLGVGRAADTTNSPADPKIVMPNAEQMKALRKEVDDAYGAYIKAIENRKPEDQADNLWKVYRLINETNLPKIFELARQEPASEPAFETYDWAITNGEIRGWNINSNGLQAIEFLRDYDETNPNVAKICWVFGNLWDPTCRPAVDFLRIAADKNPNREVRGQATLALALLDKKNAELLIYASESAPPGDTRFEKQRTAYLERARNENPETLSREAGKLFHVVLDKYADCPTLERTNRWAFKATLGEVAKAELYELDHLEVGKVAPEIEGEDIDGKKLKLSDYRGKVVVLSFWASWCGPCMAMVPSEVRLVERMKGKPFALVGVNGDTIREDAKRAVEKEKMAWPSFWSKEGPDGPIPTA